jgi:hypothetical protein
VTARKVRFQERIDVVAAAEIGLTAAVVLDLYRRRHHLSPGLGRRCLDGHLVLELVGMPGRSTWRRLRNRLVERVRLGRGVARVVPRIDGDLDHLDFHHVEVFDVRHRLWNRWLVELDLGDRGCGNGHVNQRWPCCLHRLGGRARPLNVATDAIEQ